MKDANKAIEELIINSFESGVEKILVITGKGLRSKNKENPYVSEDLSILKYSVPEYIKSKETKELGGLKFEAKIIASKEEHDISRNWIPSQEDFTKSLNQIKNNELTYDFASVKELYLEDYQPIQLKAY